MDGKRRSGSLPFFIILLSLVLTSVLILTGLPQDQNIDRYEKELTDIAARIDSLQKLLEQEQKRESTIIARLEQIGIRKELIRKEISLQHTMLRKTEAELEATQQRIGELRQLLERDKESILRILSTLYKFGRISYSHLFLQVKDVSSLVSGNKHLALLAHSQDKVIDTYLSTLTELNTSERDQKTRRITISEILMNAQAKREELSRAERNSLNLITQIEENKETHQSAIEELNMRAQELQNLIKELINAQVNLPFTPIPLMDVKGRLDWPVDGLLISRFGLQTHPRFKTVTKNNGVEISPRSTNMVKAVHPAVVAYSDYFQGYGNLLILDHGLKYYTLYGHLSDFLVNKGDVVRTGQPIAVVGDLGSLKGESLYFEIRFQTQPLNPLQWLKRK